ncbi:hypothetical protein POVWA2_047200 [Plasmodium ovale wallikeri]|uniref:Uncharacterized protein n=1 Tax=Plasmodium ovale wallikeri TaxID=864142 RepID=A0A1A8ZJ18_PLAOA|nr:hypothetical protein POVWA2_047200 [Plasmodium ovale wallikeri]
MQRDEGTRKCNTMKEHENATRSSNTKMQHDEGTRRRNINMEYTNERLNWTLYVILGMVETQNERGKIYNADV